MSGATSKVGDFASKAKTPLLAGGAALAGLAGGIALQNQNRKSKNPLKKVHAPSMPKQLKKVDLSKIDLDTFTSAGHRIRSLGEQVGAVADAAEKANKKHG